MSLEYLTLSQLDEITSLNDADLCEVSQVVGGGRYHSKKITWANILANLSYVSNIEIQAFTTAGSHTFTTPADTKFVIAEVVGGGGDGIAVLARPPDRDLPPGLGLDKRVATGGGGGYSRKVIGINDLGSTVPITVGANNGTSSFGSHCSATGGTDGTYGVGVATPGTPGSGSAGDINIDGEYGQAYHIYDPNQDASVEVALQGGSSPIGSYGRGASAPTAVAGSLESNPGNSGAVIITVFK